MWGCVSCSEVERTDRLLTKLTADVENRQRLLAGGGFSSLADQRAAAPPGERLPHLLLLLDRWEGFTTAFEAIDGGRLVGMLQHLLRGEGPSGVCVLRSPATDRSWWEKWPP